MTSTIGYVGSGGPRFFLVLSRDTSEGVERLREFVVSGGTLVTLNRASSLPLQEWELPVQDALGEAEGVYCPGALLRVQVEPGSPEALFLDQPGTWVVTKLDQILEVGRSICPGDMPHASSERRCKERKTP